MGMVNRMRTDHARRTLPIADMASVARHSRGLVLEHRRYLSVVVVQHALAALAALAGPWLVGRLVDTVSGCGTGAEVDRLGYRLFAILSLIATREVAIGPVCGLDSSDRVVWAHWDAPRMRLGRGIGWCPLALLFRGPGLRSGARIP